MHSVIPKGATWVNEAAASFVLFAVLGWTTIFMLVMVLLRFIGKWTERKSGEL